MVEGLEALGVQPRERRRRYWSETAWMKVPEVLLGLVDEGRLSFPAFGVYCVLLRHRYHKTQQASLSVYTIADILHFNRRKVRRCLGELVKLKLVTIRRGGSRERLVYTLQDITSFRFGPIREVPGASR